MESLLSFDDGTSQGPWTLVGGTSIADILDQADGDTTYVWRADASVDDYFDLKLDQVSGEVETEAVGDVTLSFRCKSADKGKSEITIEIYEGDPNDGGTLVGDRKQGLDDDAWLLVEATFSWAVVQAAITDFDDLYLRIVVSKFGGSPMISLVGVEIPGTINKSAASPQRVEAELGKTYNIHLLPLDGARVRKVTYSASPTTGEGRWYDREGTDITDTVRDFEVPE